MKVQRNVSANSTLHICRSDVAVAKNSVCRRENELQTLSCHHSVPCIGLAGCNLHGRECEFDAVFIEGFLDQHQRLSPNDKLLAGHGHHFGSDLDREVAELFDVLHFQ